MIPSAMGYIFLYSVKIRYVCTFTRRIRMLNLRLQNGQQTREKLSFEVWKMQKTNAYRQILKKIEAERQQKLLENLANAQWKKIIQQTQMRKKQQEIRNQRTQKLLSRKNLGTIKRANVPMVQTNSNRIEEQPGVVDKCVSNVRPREQKGTDLGEKPWRTTSKMSR
ncbi:hypothetical protein ANTRET_LOCUS7625 [Anthophora retusa]